MPLASFLFDENLPPQLAEGLRTCGLDTYAIGTPAAPPRGSSDAENVAWCLEHGAALLTSDRGRRNPEMRELLAHTDVSMILIRIADPLDLLYAFVRRHQEFDAQVERALARRGSYRCRLNRGGGLQQI